MDSSSLTGTGNGKSSANLLRREAASNNGERSTRSPVAETKPAAADCKLESKASMDINESAEAFIKKFRKQLLIQRLDSIENYQQMLARGAEAATNQLNIIWNSSKEIETQI